MAPMNRSTRKSERLEKMSAPTADDRRKSKRVEKEIPSPLRRSERTKNHTSSTANELLGSSDSKQKKEKSVKQLMTFEAKEVSVNVKDANRIAQVDNYRRDARAYRAIFSKKPIQENVNHPLLPSADAKVQEMRAGSSLIGSVKEPLEKNDVVQLCNTRWRRNSGDTHEPEGADCVEWSEGGNFKRKRVDHDPIVQEDFSCSTKSNEESVNPSATEDIESGDILKKRRKITNNVDQPSSKSEGEGKISTGNKEGNPGDSVGNGSKFLLSSTACVINPLHANNTCTTCLVDYMSERPAAHIVESDEVRKLRYEQRCLHLLLKPEIAKLCEILHLPVNVKIIVEKFLEYVMNNHRVHREPVSILQAFQISLCWTAASVLKHKIDHKASLLLAKQHLNFDCKKEEVDYICSMLRCLKNMFLYRTGNSNLVGLPNTSELSKKLHSCSGVAREFELAEKDISKCIKEIQKKSQKQLTKLLLKQEEEKDWLNAIIKERKAEEEHKHKLELAAVRSLTPNNVIRKKKLEDLDAKYAEIIEDLKCQHEMRLKDLETVQLAARQVIQDREATWVKQVKSWAQIELLSLLPSKKLGTGVEYLRTSEQVQAHNCDENGSLGSDEVANGCTSVKMVQTMPRNGIGYSETPEIISPVAVPYSNPVEVQTPVDNNVSGKEMDTVVPEGGSVSRNKDHNRAKDASHSQVDLVSLHSHSKEQNCDGGTITDGREVHTNITSDNCKEDKVALDLASSVEEICDGALSDIPSREVAVEVLKAGSSTDGLDDVPTNWGNLKGTMLCEISLGEVETVGSHDSVVNIVSLDVHKTGSSTDGLDIVPSPNQGNLDGTTLFDPGSDISLGEVNALGSHDGMENIASNSQSSEVRIQSKSAICMLACENSAQIHESDDNNGLNNAVPLDPPLSEESIERAIISGMPGTENLFDLPNNVVPVNPPSSVEQISDGGVINALGRELLSRIHSTACPSDGPDTVALLNPLSSEQQIFDGVSLSVPHARVPGEVPETSHELAECHNDTENQTYLDKSTTSFQQEGLSGTVNGNMTQAAPALSSSLLQPSVIPSQAPAISANEALQDAYTSSFVSSGAVDEAAIAGEMQNSSQQVEPVFCTVGVVPANQCSHETLVMEPPVHGQQLPSAEYLSSNHPSNLPSATVIEHQPVNEDNHSGCVTQGSIEAPNQAVVKPTSNHESLAMGPLLQRQPLPSAEYPPSNEDPSELEYQPINKDNLSCHVPLESIEASNQAVVQPASNHEALIIEPPEQGQLLPSTECPSNHSTPNLPSYTNIEHQPINEDNNISRHATFSSTEVPNQVVVQAASSSELDSYTTAGRFRTQSTDTRNVSTSEYNIHPTQIASRSASRNPPPLYCDPLQNELERIHKEIQQTVKFHEDMKLQMKSDFEKEIEELHRKYDIKLHELEVEFQQRKKSLDTNLNIVVMNKILAEAFRSKCMDLKVSNASAMQQDASFVQQLVQLSRQQTGIRPSLVAIPSSHGTHAASLQSTSTTTSSQTMMPTSQAAYNTSTIFSNFSTRPPHINSISPSSGNLQVGSEIRAPAPHLRPYRPSSPMPAAGPATLSNGMPVQRAPSNIAATPSPSFPQLRPRPSPSTHQSPGNVATTSSTSFPQLQPRPSPSTHQSPSNVAATPPLFPQLRPRPTLSTHHSDPHNRGNGSDRARGLPTAKLSPMELRMDANSQSGANIPNVMPRLSDEVALNRSQFGTGDSGMQGNTVHLATPLDIVCLSDDD